MGIQMTGIDHNMAGIDIRTIFSFTKKQMAAAFEFLKQTKGIEGCVMISTCNRMELWASTGEEFSGSLYDLLCQIRAADPAAYRPYFRSLEGREAVNHLFRLAGGLESRILGEDQIVTQVNDALAFAREHYAADHVLETLFRQAVTAAKKVKTTVVLTPADQSVVHTAIETLKSGGLEFAGKTCMVIGNGVMGRLAATQLQKQGADVTVTVRQYHSGVVDIPRGCERIDYGRRLELLGDCDYVVSATVSPNFTLTKEQAASVLKKPLVLVDLAVPRDIDPDVRSLPGVRLFDIDCFREEARSEAQKEAVRQADLCLQEQIREFYVWYECLDVIPRIQEIREKAAADVGARLTKKLRELPVGGQDREKLRADIEAAAEKAVNRMLFGLRDGVGRNTLRECLECLEKLYG